MIKDHKESIAEMKRSGKLKDWLADQYKQVIGEWDNMEEIATSKVEN